MKIITILGLFILFSAAAFGSNQPNVLFIIVDDLRPEIKSYGADHMHTPNMDRLAQEGLLFENAYCNVPVCGASRASMLTGLRPTKDRFRFYNSRADEDAPGIIDLPSVFKSAGYRTVSNGKVYHHPKENAASWDEFYRPPHWAQYFNPENIAKRKLAKEKGEKWLPAFEASNEPVESYQGYKIAQKAIEELRLSKQTQKPAFITVGFTKPHLPFNCPKKYWDLYPASSISLPDNYEKAKDIPNQLVNATDVELKRGYTNIPNDKNPLSEELAIELIRGYFACVSFTDDMIGLIFEEMDKEGFWDNTIVVLTSDHGFQIGDHGVWCKHSLYDTSLRSPLIISIPGMEGSQRTEALVEYVDLYPTLCDLVGIPKPGHLEGKSFASLFANPNKPWDAPVFSRWLNGDSIKTQRYLYSQWRSKQGDVIAKSLFDHVKDPDENYNLANNPESEAIIAKLSQKLNAFVEQNEK